jgi:hypothetical protein
MDVRDFVLRILPLVADVLHWDMASSVLCAKDDSANNFHIVRRLPWTPHHDLRVFDASLVISKDGFTHAMLFCHLLGDMHACVGLEGWLRLSTISALWPETKWSWRESCCCLFHVSHECFFCGLSARFRFRCRLCRLLAYHGLLGVISVWDPGLHRHPRNHHCHGVSLASRMNDHVLIQLAG